MARHPRTRSMAEIIAEVREEASRAPARTPAVEDDGLPWLAIDGRRFVIEEELTPRDARDLVETSRLVVWDSCGCGGGCGYEVWEGAEVSDLLEAGLPKLKDGWIHRIEDREGRLGVLVEQDVRWGPLR